jgi:uncharacterized membrane protein
MFVWLMVGEAMALGMAGETVVLAGDVGRMNTMFRLYQQAWVLLSVAASASLVGGAAPLVHRLPARWRYAWWSILALLCAAGALFLPLGIRSRSLDRISADTGATLDGMAFMADSRVIDGPEGMETDVSLAGDLGATEWLQENVAGSPVIIEGLGRREYLWANRVSVYTGLPAVVGWSWHQRQQRAGLRSESEVEARRREVDEFYHTADIDRACQILRRYGVGLVYLGPYESAYYPDHGLAKFGAMAEAGILERIYDAAGVQIYQVIGDC